MHMIELEPRTERVLLRLRPIELERAKALAKADELRVPELLRRLINKQWQESHAEVRDNGQD